MMIQSILYSWRSALLLPGYLIACLFMLPTSALSAQDNKSIIQEYLTQHLAECHLTEGDIMDWIITDSHVSKQSGATYVYIMQQYHGIPVANGVANFAIREGKVITMGNRLIDHLSNKIQYQSPALNPSSAIQSAAQHLSLNAPRSLQVVEVVSPTEFVISSGGISKKDIPVKLMYHAVDANDIRLVWDMILYTTDGDHWWSMRLDAQTGAVVAQHDQVIHCQFDASPFAHAFDTHTDVLPSQAAQVLSPAVQPDQYTVIPLPAESPNHGVRASVQNPADPIASPFGWHDTDGVTGAEYTITRGNNVYAYEDADNDDLPGFSPDGTPALDFNFPYNPQDNAANYQAAALTNLFYMNNMMHDIWYQYGFDETSGNFQANNYQVGGAANDDVQAEAQDGGGLNNANFGTPPDGSSPRMQMYLWNNTEPGNFLVINTPAIIAGPFFSSAASFGPALPAVPITADLVLVEDDTDPINDGCSAYVNGGAIAGKIAMIDRGDCTFVEKVQAAQDAGAVAVIIVNNIDGDPIQMGGASPTITIPAIMIAKANGDIIKAQMVNGPVNGSISNGGGAVTTILDGDFDNGIIAHEYGHGISTRLVGGPDNVNCLFNAEQMGEGWSDWFGLMLTIEPGDRGSDVRGIGTFAIAQPTTGVGIRPAPYSTDMSINPYTYSASNDEVAISQPHGVGFIFATMLWDMTWALVDYYGGTPDPDVYTGTGGNNVAMKLVIEGLKLTTCNPGMVDGRNAILEADQLLYGGEHQCLIWEVFARRGLGFSADQGSADSRIDQIEAFDLPTTCQTATDPPIAAFQIEPIAECSRTVTFMDNSTQIPQGWIWYFGDGSTSEIRNPVHTYARGGTYEVKLVVTNTIGIDSTVQQVDIILPPVPVVADVRVCSGTDATLIAETTGQTVWRDSTQSLYFIGDTLILPSVESEQTFYVENLIVQPSEFVGPVDGSFANGGYHGSGYFGAINFTAEQGFNIVSAWVDAESDGNRTFVLGRGTNFDGQVPVGDALVQEVTVFIPAGQHRVDLNIAVPEAGDYCIGASLNNGSRLFRNNGGAQYPYALPGYMTLTSSSANTDPSGFYYYLYDFELRVGSLCVSDQDTVKVSPLISQFSYTDDGNATITCTDASVGATSWLWDFGDGNTSTEQNPIHTYEAEGDYVITLTVNGLPCPSSQTFTYLMTGTTDGFIPLSLALQPNPARTTTTLQLNESLSEDLNVEVEDFNGKRMASYTIPAGKRDLLMEVGDWPSAVYIIQVSGKSYWQVKKFVVGQ